MEGINSLFAMRILPKFPKLVLEEEGRKAIESHNGKFEICTDEVAGVVVSHLYAIKGGEGTIYISSI